MRLADFLRGGGDSGREGGEGNKIRIEPRAVEMSSVVTEGKQF